MGREYWRRRAAEYEREWAARCESELERELARYFRESLKEIEEDVAALYGRYAAENGLTYREARRLIRGAEYREWRLTLQEYVALSHVDSAILKELNTLAMRSRISRLERVYSETLKELQRLGERSESAVRDFLMTAYRERYYHGIYDLATAGKLAIPVAKVEPSRLEKVLAAKWQGGNYSTRIWKNTEQLSAVLKRTLTAGLHRGLSVQKMAKAIDAEMNSGYKNAERLVRTELNFVQNQSARESMEAAGLSEYEFIATLDNRTSQRCRSLDGTIHLLEEYDPGTNAPPMHPRCRSTISAVINEGTRTAKVRGKNIRVPADMTYGDFKKVYFDKSLTLEGWQSQRESDKISAEVKGVAVTGAFDPRSLIAPTLPVKSRRFIEFQTYWSKNYNVKVSDELAKLDFDAVKAAADGIESMLKLFPAAIQELTEFRVRADLNIMSTSYAGQIAFNPIYFDSCANLNNLAEMLVSEGFYPKGTGIKQYGMHEVVHILEIVLIKRRGGDLSTWRSHLRASQIVISAYDNIRTKDSKDIFEFRRAICRHAADYNAAECLADAVVDYITNRDAASLSREIGRLFWEEFK